MRGRRATITKSKMGELTMNSRIQRVLESIEELGLNGLLLVQNESITKKNFRYVTGFTGSTGYALVTPDRQVMLLDTRYFEQAQQQCPGFEVLHVDRPFTNKLVEIVSEMGCQRLGFEAQGITVAMLDNLKQELPDVDWVSTTKVVETLRATKDEDEVELLATAAELGDKIFDHIVPLIKEGVAEKDLGYEFECFTRQLGAPRMAFDLIIGSGYRSTHQHGSPTDKKLEQGDFVVMDFGVEYQGYLSDMTRTVVVGEATAKQREVYDAVRRAEQLGVELMQPGMDGQEASRRVTQVLIDAGYGEYGTKGIGHGVGLEIHEEPFVGNDREAILTPGNVVTVEPGIYIPGWGGVRIEDMVEVTESGPRVLTHSTRELIEL